MKDTIVLYREKNFAFVARSPCGVIEEWYPLIIVKWNKQTWLHNIICNLYCDEYFSIEEIQDYHNLFPDVIKGGQETIDRIKSLLEIKG